MSNFHKFNFRSNVFHTHICLAYFHIIILSLTTCSSLCLLSIYEFIVGFFRVLVYCWMGFSEQSQGLQYQCKTDDRFDLVFSSNDATIYLYHELKCAQLFCRENAGLLALTKVGSRRVVQIAAGFMIFFSVLGENPVSFCLCSLLNLGMFFLVCS